MVKLTKGGKAVAGVVIALGVYVGGYATSTAVNHDKTVQAVKQAEQLQYELRQVQHTQKQLLREITLIKGLAVDYSAYLNDSMPYVDQRQLTDLYVRLSSLEEELN